MILEALRKKVAIVAAGGVAAAGFALAHPQGAFPQSYGARVTFESLSFVTTKVIDVHSETKPMSVWGFLSVPGTSSGRVPAVILAHGCGGIASNTAGWVKELNGLGIATFVLDVFTGRGVREACTTGTRDVNIASWLVDAYRALVLLASDPRIDPQRIALMGFSLGGWATLWAGELRFQRAWMPAGGHQFAAYLAFYPGGCWFRLLNEEQVVDRPIRIFHGTADDYTPIGQCSAYVDRMRQAGKDVALIAYPGAYHGFDQTEPPHRNPNAITGRLCTWSETADGQFIEKSGRAFGRDDPCVQRGTTGGGNEGARRQAVEDVSTLLRRLFKLGQ